MITLVEKWATINSGSNNFQGINQMRGVLKNAFGPLGDATTEIDLIPRHTLSPDGIIQSIPAPQGLSVIKRSSAGRQIFLNGHMDTVFGIDSPFQRCQHLDHGRMGGPGVADLKGGLVILLIALEALERSPYAGQMGWELFLNPDEEIGSTSSTPYLLQRAPHFDVGLIVEPQFSDGAFVSGRKGSATFSLVARGKSAHAGRDFHQGVSAILALLSPLQSLNTLNDPASNSTLNIGVVRGGTAINIVPDLAFAQFEVRSTSLEVQQTLIEQVQEVVDNASLRVDPATLELHLMSYRSPKPFDASTQALFAEVKKCAYAIGIPMEWRESGGVCDGNTLASVGLPVIDSMGAAGGNIHTFDEYIDLDKLTQRARHVALVLLSIASGAFSLPKKQQFPEITGAVSPKAPRGIQEDGLRTSRATPETRLLSKTCGLQKGLDYDFIAG